MLSSLAPQRLAFKFFYPTLGSGGCRKFIANGSYLNLTIPLCYGYARLWCHLENELRSPPVCSSHIVYNVAHQICNGYYPKILF
jgi:hypothetical protein